MPTLVNWLLWFLRVDGVIPNFSANVEPSYVLSVGTTFNKSIPPLTKSIIRYEEVKVLSVLTVLDVLTVLCPVRPVRPKCPGRPGHLGRTFVMWVLVKI